MKNILVNVFILFAILTLGTSGYMLIEGSPFLDSLYMTMITITTVGYGEMIHLSAAGRIFTMGLILIGMGYVLYMVSKITEAMVEGGLRRILGRINMQKKVSKLTGHYMVCGFGRIGKVICDSLKQDHRTFVVIEKDPEEVQRIADLGYLVIQGDAANDETLLDAGIKQAKGLIAVVTSDAENVFIVLSARGLNTELFILARSSGVDGVETKLLRAGANKVISPYFIGGCRMAQLIVRPTVVDFVDLTVNGGALGLRLEEMIVSGGARYVGQTLLDSDIRKEFDLIVVAIKRENGEMIFNPNPQTGILAEDTLVVLGEHGNIKMLEKEMRI